MIELDTLRYARRANGETVPVIEDLSLRVEPGKIVALLGPSGCGKSTALDLAAGFLSPDSGRATVTGSLTCVFQAYGILPWLTASSNVRMGIRDKKAGKRAVDERVESLLAAVGLSDFADKRPHELSGGMRQRIALARAFAADAQNVLLDEAFGALDPRTRKDAHSLLSREIVRTGAAVLMVTHDTEEAALLADTIVVVSARPCAETLRVEISEPRAARTRESRAVRAAREKALAALAPASRGPEYYL